MRSPWAWLTAAATLSPPAPYSGGRELGVASPWSDPSLLQRITLEELWPAALAELDSLPLTRAEAESVPSVAACRHRIVGTLSRLPLRAVYADTLQPWKDTTTGQALRLLTQPDPGEPRSVTMAKTLSDMLYDGGAYWGVTNAYRTGGADDAPWRPWSAVHIPREHITAGAAGLARVSDEFRRSLLATRGVELRSLPGRETVPWLLYFEGPGPGLLTRPRAIRAAINLDRAAGHAADNPVPSIELHQVSDDTLTTGEIQDLIRQWALARRRGGVGYTNKSIEAKVLGIDNSQLLIDGRNQQSVEIARLAGIPAASIDAGIPGTSLTYANLVDRQFDLVNSGLQPYAEGITGRLSMEDVLPRNVIARVDYTDLYPAAAPAAQPATPAPQPSGAQQ